MQGVYGSWSCLFTYTYRHVTYLHACSVSWWVFCDKCTHTPHTYQCYNGCLCHTPLCVLYFVSHDKHVTNLLYRSSSSHHLLKLVSQSALNYRSWQWEDALPLSLLPSWTVTGCDDRTWVNITWNCIIIPPVFLPTCVVSEWCTYGLLHYYYVCMWVISL